MNTTELRDMYRAEMFDAIEPFLCSDDLLYEYINDAQRQFCRWTEGIEDARSFSITLATNTDWYPLDPMILKIRSATDSTSGRQVAMYNPEKAAAAGVRFDGKLGPIRALVFGLEKNYVRASPYPNVVSTINLQTFRLPYAVIAGDDFEIDEQHHQHLLMWVKHRTYNIQDSDLYDRRKSDEYAARFREYCDEARKEQERARRVIGTVQYGGL